MEALEEGQNLERRLENEEAEFKKRELEVEEKRKRSKAELTGKLERIAVEKELKEAVLELEIEVEESQSGCSDERSEENEATPVLSPKLGLDAPRPKISLTPEILSCEQLLTTSYAPAELAPKDPTIKQEVLSTSPVSQDVMLSQYLPLPNSVASQQKTRSSPDVHEFTPLA